MSDAAAPRGRVTAATPAPFAIGLRPIGEAAWLRPDERLAAYPDEKARLNEIDLAAVHAAIPGMKVAQAEVERLVTGWLATHSPRHDERGEVRDRPAPGARPRSRPAVPRRAAPSARGHARVRGSGRHAALVDGMLAKLREGVIVGRGNWSLHAEGALHPPVAKHDLDGLAPHDALHRWAERHAIASQLRGLDRAQLGYKGVVDSVGSLMERLERG